MSRRIFMIGQYPPDSIQRDSPVYCSGLVDAEYRAGRCESDDIFRYRKNIRSANRLGLLPDFAAAIDAWPTPGNHFSTRWEMTTPMCRSNRPKPCQLFIFQKSSFRTGSRPRRGHPYPSSHD